MPQEAPRVIRHPLIQAVVDQLPKLAYARTLGAEYLRDVLKRQKGECTLCGGPISKGRRTWCDVCSAIYVEHCMDSRWAINRRDNGVCGRCGFDTKKMRELSHQFHKLASNYHQTLTAEQRSLAGRWWCGCLLCVSRLEAEKLTKWEADHIVPVIEGGGLCSLEGIRTLCLPCHRIETKALAGRRAAK